MLRYKSIFIYGFALFAMFFGSGNLVFPLQIGQMTGQFWLLGFLGLLLTGILLPFLGLFVIKLYHGSIDRFFTEAGPIARVMLPLFAISLLGSFGVVPRCITVAHGGIGYLLPQISLIIFSGIFSLITYLLCLKDQVMIRVIGKWMSPILLMALAILIWMGITGTPTINAQTPLEPTQAFQNGFLTGYLTMDLFAAFFFSALMFSQLQKMMPKTATLGETIKFAIKPSIFGAGLLGLIYLGFVYLGAHYADLIAAIEPECQLPAIAHHLMGDHATWIIGIAMVFSCLTTAVALNNIYARHLTTLFGLSPDKFPHVLLGTTGTSCLISLLDFKGIAAVISPALDVSYPGIIMLTILSIVTRKGRWFKMATFYGITIFMMARYFW